MKNDQFAVYRVDRHSEGRDLWHLSYQEAVSRKLAIRIEHYRQIDIRLSTAFIRVHPIKPVRYIGHVGYGKLSH